MALGKFERRKHIAKKERDQSIFTTCMALRLSAFAVKPYFKISFRRIVRHSSSIHSVRMEM